MTALLDADLASTLPHGVLTLGAGEALGGLRTPLELRPHPVVDSRLVDLDVGDHVCGVV